MDMTLLTTTEGNDQFYPTPEEVSEKMLAGIDWSQIENILEPSAGKGNLVLSALKSSGDTRHKTFNMDCIEIDPYLRAILKQNIDFEWTRGMNEELAAIKDKDYKNQWLVESRLKDKIRQIDGANIHIIHDDFLSFRSWRRYQLILMNPPFADGDKHLLKALEIQKDGGAVICLLNAETLNNPYTNSRKLLQRELDRYGAEITVMHDAFKNAERTANVDVAIVRVYVPAKEEVYSDIWERMEEAEKARQMQEPELRDVIVGDFVEATVQRYNVEVAASLELIRKYTDLRPYITEELDPQNKFDETAILTLSVGRDSNYLQSVDLDKYLRTVRHKYWRALFHNEKFMGRLTSALREKYVKTVDRMANYDFSLFNIRTVMVEMNAQVIDGVKEAILTLFDRLTAEYSYYPESTTNVHLYNGWKTNMAHKLGKKSIIPGNGMFSSYSWSKDTFSVHNAWCVLSDIEKVFDYLAGDMTNEQDTRERLQIADRAGKTRNIPLKYFDVDIYKKGTVHIKYRNMELIDRFNIYAGRNRNWLPPCYGKASYTEMSTEEKEVINNFQGQKEYERIMAKADYFLAEPTRNVQLLSVSEDT